MEQLRQSIVEHLKSVEVAFTEAKQGDAYVFFLSTSGQNMELVVQLRIEPRFVRIYIPRGPHVPIEKRSIIAELLCRKNWILSFGAMTMDFEDGEVRFEASLPKEAPFTTGEIMNLMAASLLSADWTNLAIDLCLAGDTPKKAIENADSVYELWRVLSRADSG